MDKDKIKEKFLIYSKLKIFEKNIEKSKEIVHLWLSKCNNPYVAFSGGKDSTCVLNLVREQKDNITAVYFDADCAFPEVEFLLNDTKNLIKHKCPESFLEILQNMINSDKIEQETMKKTVFIPVKEIIKKYNFDSCAYGLRFEESKARLWNYKTHGHMFRNESNILMCQPIVHWSYYDVWAYIISQNIEYCKTYDKMWDMPEKEQRISYWAGESNINFGRWAWLKKNHLELFNLLRNKIKEASLYT